MYAGADRAILLRDVTFHIQFLREYSSNRPEEQSSLPHPCLPNATP